MRSIRWTPLALSELKTISGYIEGQRNLATANRVCGIIYDAVQMLRRFPESGKTGIEEGTRELVVPALLRSLSVMITRGRLPVARHRLRKNRMAAKRSRFGGTRIARTTRF